MQLQRLEKCNFIKSSFYAEADVLVAVVAAVVVAAVVVAAVDVVVVIRVRFTQFLTTYPKRKRNNHMPLYHKIKKYLQH